MSSFFQKKLILLDVDHTLIDWTSLRTLWDFRSEWKQKVQQSNLSPTFRGLRTPADRDPQMDHSQKQIQLGSWVTDLILQARIQRWQIAIFSDFHQPMLMSWFERLNIHHIAIGLDIGCLKPLPDGCYQLMTQLGVCGSQTFLIGDGLRTDSRAIYSVGGHFVPIESIRNKSFSEISDWFA